MKNLILSILALLILSPQYAYAAFPTSGTGQDAYCQVPPYVTQNVKPNINLILDYSGSMQFPAYLNCSNWQGYDTSKVANCGSYSFNSGSSFKYDSTRNYYGNFKIDKYYRYNATSGYFQENASCTNTDRIGNISSNCLSGNLMNWAVTTRTDVLRKILTGGRVKVSTTDVLESEGARYVVTDETLHCKFTVTAGSTLTRLLKVENQSGYTCAIGTFSNYNMDVKTTTPTDDIKGIVHSMYPGLVDLELSVYNTTVDTIYRVGKNTSLNNYLAAINAELAYNGTPTGEAVRESKYYYQQSTSLRNTNETVVLGKANYLYDPYYEPGNLPAPCRKSFALLISDGQWNGSVDPASPAHDMRKNDLRTDSALPGKQNVSTYTVYAFGDGNEGRQAMITTAIFGGYDDNDNNGWPFTFTSLPSDSSTIGYPRSNCTPSGTWDARCAEWDKEKTGLPYNFFEGDDGGALQVAITKAVNDILGRVTSGTAASILGNNDNNGATMLQALYFPERQFGGGTKASWTGELQSLWYYIDPELNSSKITIREDTVSDKELRLTEDRIAEFSFNGTQVDVNLFLDGNGDGAADGSDPDESGNTDSVKALWRAGLTLWARLPSGTGGRTVYTKNPSSNNLMTFNSDAANRDLLKGYLDVASNNTDAENVINFTRGVDLSGAGYRNRSVTIGGVSNVWKLGDIINSTPKLLSGSALNTYGNKAPGGYSDTSYEAFAGSKNYKNRGVAFVGANDGMLHAFKMGRSYAGSAGSVLKIRNPDNTVSTDLGKELWGYVPHNVLPYLKHMGNPSYKHLFYVDSTPMILDAAIGATKLWTGSGTIECDEGITGSTPYHSCAKVTTRDSDKNFILDNSGVVTEGSPTAGTSWRTVLIGSMGLGGATRNYGASCSDCVKTPLSGVGYSSYFALDVTEPDVPKLLWEFSHPRLGFSTVLPAIVRIKDPADDGLPGNHPRNGRWYAILANGPTGPIDTSSNQMKAYSDQPLTIFVLDLKTGSPVHTFSSDSSAIITGVGHTTYTGMPAYAFGGSFSDATIDTDRWDLSRYGSYSDDGVYLGYVRKDTTTGSASLGKYAKGGVLRLLTGDNYDPSTWKVAKVIDGIGPVSSAVTKLQDKRNGKLWLYFGTGRYYFKSGSTIDEDYTAQREAIFGVKDLCYNGSTNDLDNVDCSTSITESSLENQTLTVSPVSTKPGWKIDLALASGTNNAQRIITNPVPSSAGLLFFTAFKPSADVCSYGGKSSLWAVTYNAGGPPSALLRGQALIQLSTGAFEQIDLATSFSQSGGRETEESQGVPPGPEPPILSNADHFPSKKILQIRER